MSFGVAGALAPGSKHSLRADELGAGDVAEEDSPDDERLLEADERAPDRGRGRLGDVDGRRVHREADPAAVHEAAQEEDGELRRAGHERGARGVEARAQLELGAAAEVVPLGQGREAAGEGARERRGHDEARLQRREVAEVSAGGEGDERGGGDADVVPCCARRGGRGFGECA